MILSVDDFKRLVVWCQDHGVKSFSVGGASAEIGQKPVKSLPLPSLKPSDDYANVPRPPESELVEFSDEEIFASGSAP